MHQFGSDYFHKYYKGPAEARGAPHKYRMYLELLREHLASGTVLEIGCGYGSFLKLASQYYEVIGVDISAYALGEIRNLHSGNPCQLICASGDALPFSKKFDAIVAFDCLEHLYGLGACLREMGRLQDDGGLLMIVVPVYDTIVGKVVGMLDNDITHLHKLSRYSWLGMLRDANYEIEMIKGVWRYLIFKRWYVTFTISLWKVAPAILVIARKGRHGEPEVPGSEGG